MKKSLKISMSLLSLCIIVVFLFSKPADAATNSSYITDTNLDTQKAWAKYQKLKVKKRQVIVAVIDTGVDYSHPDLKDAMWVNNREIPDDGIDNDNNGYVDDVYGWNFCKNKPLFSGTYSNNDNNIHGTHCAGIIAAAPNKKLRTPGGIASNIDIKIMPLKVLACKGNSVQGSGSTKSAIKAIQYAQAMGADICNISWVTSAYDPLLEQVIRESNMLFITAAGNNGTNNNSSLVYPACFNLENLISVAATESDGSLSQTSNYGISSVEIAAPGVGILSTANGGYTKMSGTSMAAPHVTAVAAILYSLKDSLYPSNIKEILINTMKPCSFLEGYIKNPGVVNAYNAVSSDKDLSPDNIPPTLNIKTRPNKDKILLTLTPEDIGGSQIRVIKYMHGSKEVEDFVKGTKGTLVNGTMLLVKKTGLYTFYISDYSGNENRVIINVIADTQKPHITYLYDVLENRTQGIVLINATDKGSGIKTVKVLKGTKKVSDFITKGIKLKITDGKRLFYFNSFGKYTIYAEDYRGNKAVKVINIKR